MHLKRLFPLSALAIACVALAPICAGAASPSVSKTDRTFVFGASSGNIAEIDAARVALSRGDAGVKAFATTMISDHTTMERGLSTVASKVEVDVQTKPTAAQRAALTRISKLSGIAFDRAYRSNQVAAHEATIALLQAEIKMGSTTALQAAARKNLPIVMMHLKMARKLSTNGM
jgi:putative membrane protein